MLLKKDSICLFSVAKEATLNKQWIEPGVPFCVFCNFHGKNLCGIGSGLDRFLRVLEDCHILVCQWVCNSGKPEVTGSFEGGKKMWSFSCICLIFTVILQRL